MKAAEVIELYNELKPEIPALIDKARELGTDVLPLLESLVDNMIDLRIRAIKRITKDRMFTIDQAIEITNNMTQEIKNATSKANN